MARTSERQDLQQHYEGILRSVHQLGLAEEDNRLAQRLDTNQLEELQGLWHAAQLGKKSTSLHHGTVIIRDFGQWNRAEGPDFLHVELEINGQWVKGHAHFTCNASDWEKRGCHQSPLFDDAVLHICLKQGSSQRKTRTRSQRELATICIPEATWRDALGLAPKLNVNALALCQQPLEESSYEQVQKLLQSAAAYRIARKRMRFESRVKALGKSQAWYEAWAEALGYHSNKHQMKLLARRVPLRELNEHNAEAILFGTAGFLIPVLPSKAEGKDRDYHRLTWDTWWPLRDQFELLAQRAPQWKLAGQRPMNHPNRRVAALAATVMRWGEFEALLSAEHLDELEQFRQSLSHDYWNYHSALPSTSSPRSVALVGQERMRAFLVNHLLVNDDSPLAWEIYLKQQERSIAGKIGRLAQHLFGDRPDLMNLLTYCYAQQGILQLGLDFAAQQGKSYPQALSELSGLSH